MTNKSVQYSFILFTIYSMLIRKCLNDTFILKFYMKYNL